MLTNRFHYPVYKDAEGFFSFEQTEGIPITMEVVENGIEKAVAAVRGKKQVLLALGCNSVINAKEEIDQMCIRDSVWAIHCRYSPKILKDGQKTEDFSLHFVRLSTTYLLDSPFTEMMN